VVQVALPVASTLTAEQPAIVAPLAEKLTFPEGATGVNAPPASWAVKVTESLMFVEFEGEAVKPSVVASALMLWMNKGALVPWKLASPE
jgi:hypothetical protein